jgi:aldehyde dehydrogenase (NAD+)
MLRENIEVIVQAFATDLRKPRLEVFAGEIGPMIRRAAQSAAQLDEWVKDERLQVPDGQQAWSPTVLKSPKGVVLVISWVSIQQRALSFSRTLSTTSPH